MDAVELHRRAAGYANRCGRVERAVALAREALGRAEAGGDPGRVALLHHRLAQHLIAAERVPDALPHAEQAVAAFEAATGSPDPADRDHAWALAGLARALMLADRPEAREVAEQAHAAAVRLGDARRRGRHPRHARGRALRRRGAGVRGRRPAPAGAAPGARVRRRAHRAAGQRQPQLVPLLPRRRPRRARGPRGLVRPRRRERAALEPAVGRAAGAAARGPLRRRAAGPTTPTATPTWPPTPPPPGSPPPGSTSRSGGATRGPRPRSSGSSPRAAWTCRCSWAWTAAWPSCVAGRAAPTRPPTSPARRPTTSPAATAPTRWASSGSARSRSRRSRTWPRRPRCAGTTPSWPRWGSGPRPGSPPWTRCTARSSGPSRTACTARDPRRWPGWPAGARSSRGSPGP